MNINDPLGDMLARIRNAQMRHKAKVTTPASKLREHVLEVLAEEGYIRGYARVDYTGGRSEFEIELEFIAACGLREQELPYNPIIALNEGGAVLH